MIRTSLDDDSNEVQGVLSNLPQLPLETEQTLDLKSDVQSLSGTQLISPVVPEPRKVTQTASTLFEEFAGEDSLSGVLSGM